MMWFILVGLIGLDGSTDQSFLFTDPVFADKQECVVYVQNNIEHLTYSVAQRAPGFAPEEFYCIEQQLLEQQWQKHKQDRPEFDFEKSI